MQKSELLSDKLWNDQKVLSESRLCEDLFPRYEAAGTAEFSESEVYNRWAEAGGEQ